MSQETTPYIGTEGARPYQGVSALYARYRPKLSDAFISLVIERLGWTAGDRLLDLGTGPGQIALRFAPSMAEVVALDPEPDQIAEARMQASTQGVTNTSFVLGASDDLSRLAPGLGMFRAATMGESFHWMLDRDRVLRDLGALLDPERAAVLLINTGVLLRSDEQLARARRTVRQVLRSFLDGVPPGPHPRGRHDPFEAILRRSPFPDVLLLQQDYDQAVEASVERLVGAEYTISHVLRRLGSRREAFEAEVRRGLSWLPEGVPFWERRRDAALVGRRGPLT